MNTYYLRHRSSIWTSAPLYPSRPKFTPIPSYCIGLVFTFIYNGACRPTEDLKTCHPLGSTCSTHLLVRTQFSGSIGSLEVQILSSSMATSETQDLFLRVYATSLPSVSTDVYQMWVQNRQCLYQQLTPTWIIRRMTIVCSNHHARYVVTLTIRRSISASWVSWYLFGTIWLLLPMR